jgi:hypothetical protein
VLAVLYSLLRQRSKKAAMVIVAVALSHWFLDFLTHRADMPITFYETTLVGLGLWNYPVSAVSLELLLFALGTWMYMRQTRARDKIGVYGLWGIVIFLVAIYFANLLAPPPPSVAVVAWSAQALWLLVALGFWVDQHRAPAVQNRP